MATVDLTVAADLSALRKQLGDIPGIGADAAAKMASELNKSIRAAEKASKAAAKATKDAATQAAAVAKKAAEANADVGDRIGRVGEASAKLRGSLSLLGGPLGEAAGLLNDLADAGEVAASASPALIPVFAAVAVAAAGLGIAYADAAREVAHANEQAQLSREINAALLPTINALRDAQIDAAVATGRLSDLMGQLATDANKAYDGVIQFGAAQKEQRNAARKAIDDNELYLEILNDIDMFGIGAATGVVALADDLLGFSENINHATATLKKLDGAVQTEADNQQDLRQVLEEVRTASEERRKEDERRRKAGERATQAARNEADAERALSDALAKAAQQRKEYTSILGTLQGVTQDATDAELTGSAAIEAALQRRIDSLNAETAQRVESGKFTTEQIVSVEQARADAVVALEAEAQSKIDALNEAALQKRLDEIAAEQAAREESARAAVSATAGLFGAIGDLAGAAAEAQVGASEEAALALFEVQKAAALAQAAINTALAVSNALVAGPPAGPILAAAALASGVAQAATIASTPPPSFSDTPGVMQMSNRGAVSLAAGDYFAAAKDPRELQRQTGGGGSASILEVRLGHRVLDRSVAQTIRQGGRLSREIAGLAKSGPTGHA